jgi:hypothetical protein
MDIPRTSAALDTASTYGPERPKASFAALIALTLHRVGHAGQSLAASMRQRLSPASPGLDTDDKTSVTTLSFRRCESASSFPGVVPTVSPGPRQSTPQWHNRG